jgi:hypothetical protein
VFVQLASDTKKSINTSIIKTYVFKNGYFGQAPWGQQDVDRAKVLDVVKITTLRLEIKCAVKRNYRLCVKMIDTWRNLSGPGVFHFVEQVTLAY